MKKLLIVVTLLFTATLFAQEGVYKITGCIIAYLRHHHCK